MRPTSSMTARALEGAPPIFPGATLGLDSEGQIVQAWHGPVSPTGATSGDVFAVLDIDDTTPEAARLQLLLAAAIGAVGAAWEMLALEAPRMLMRRDGTPLSTLWQPLVRNGMIVAVVAYVVAGEPARVETDDPAERNRICVDALALLDECDGGLRHLRAEPTARHAVHRMFRAVHTIKGSTRGAHLLREISDLAHHTEEALDILRQSEEAAAPETIDELEQDLRRLRGAVTAARPRGETDDAMTELSAEVRPALGDLRMAIGKLNAGEPETEIAVRAVARIASAAERANMRALRIQCTAAANALAMMHGPDGPALDPALIAEVAALEAHVELYMAVYREVAASDAGPSLLVTLASWMDAPEDRSGSFESLTSVMSQAGVPSLIEAFVAIDAYSTRRALGVLADAHAMFEPARPRDDASLRFERAQRDLLASIDGLAREVPQAQLAEMRAIVQRLLWTPLAVIARRLLRMTKTLGAELGKNVVAEIDLGDLLVAPEIGRVIGEILVHAVRNAADHGVESPGERTALGKDPAGLIRVTARAADVGERVIVTVSDDGRGINPQKVRASAVAKGLIGDDVILTDSEMLDLLFVPGFSTSNTVTAVSGRGVGMDVVKSLAEEQGGSVTLSSRVGAGTELSIELPLAPV